MGIFSTPMAVAVSGITPQIHHTLVKKVKAIDAAIKWTVSQTIEPLKLILSLAPILFTPCLPTTDESYVLSWSNSLYPQA